MTEEDQTIVKIGEETFSIVEIPSSGTVIVQQEKRCLLGSIDLPALVTDLGRVGNFVRIAYNGVAGYTNLQILIREIGYDVTKLCDKSAVTVSKFKQASASIIGDLQGTYQFLLDGLEDMALETLNAVADVAKDMAAAANQLCKDFDEESVWVDTALKEETVKNFEVEKTKAIEWKKKAEEEFQEMQMAAEHSSIFSANSLLSPFTGVFGIDSDSRRAQKAREDKIRKLEKMKQERNIRRQALQDIAEKKEDDAELAEVAISAMGGLQKLSTVMTKAALFWKQMQVHCEQLAKEKMQKMISTAMKRPEKDRIRVWTSNSFKTNAIRYYAEWVALDDVCAVYMKKIQETQKDLYSYLTENPTLSAARKNVCKLAITFGEDLAREQQAIADKEFAAQEEMKQLEAESEYTVPVYQRLKQQAEKSKKEKLALREQLNAAQLRLEELEEQLQQISAMAGKNEKELTEKKGAVKILTKLVAGEKEHYEGKLREERLILQDRVQELTTDLERESGGDTGQIREANAELRDVEVQQRMLQRLIPGFKGGVAISVTTDIDFDLTGVPLFEEVQDRVLTSDDLPHVRASISDAAPKWHSIGLTFGLRPSTLDIIKAANFDDTEFCLNAVLAHWLNQDYQVSRYGEPTWRKLLMVIAHPAGGDNASLADSLAKSLRKPGDATNKECCTIL